LSEGVAQLFTVPDAARLLSVSPRTVKRWIASGQLPFVVLSERSRGKRVALADLEAFVLARRKS
jgi:excisionase family DNA binding protein